MLCMLDHGCCVLHVCTLSVLGSYAVLSKRAQILQGRVGGIGTQYTLNQAGLCTVQAYVPQAKSITTHVRRRCRCCCHRAAPLVHIIGSTPTNLATILGSQQVRGRRVSDGVCGRAWGDTELLVRV
jgi:hypothetical protein